MDDNNANPVSTWVTQGSPTYPTPLQLSQLHAASQIVSQPIALTPAENNTVSFVVEMLPFSVAVVTLPSCV